jgi:hypothetical protein
MGEIQLSYLLMKNLHIKKFMICYTIGTYFLKRLKFNKLISLEKYRTKLGKVNSVINLKQKMTTLVSHYFSHFLLFWLDSLLLNYRAVSHEFYWPSCFLNFVIFFLIGQNMSYCFRLIFLDLMGFTFCLKV